MAEGYDGLPAYYIQSSDPLTPNLGLSLKGMNPVAAENFVALDNQSGPFPGDYYWYPPFEGNRSAGAFYPGSLAMAVMPVLINRKILLQNAAIGINGVSTTPNVFYYFGIYSGGKLLTSAKFPVGLGNPTGQISVALSSPILLTPGIWQFCQGSDDTGSVATGQNYQFDTDLQNLIPGVGSSSNLISGGAVPATLGTVTAPWPDSCPFIMLY